MNTYWDIVIEPHEFLFDSVFLICYERPMKSPGFLNKCFDYQVLFKRLVVSVYLYSLVLWMWNLVQRQPHLVKVLAIRIFHILWLGSYVICSFWVISRVMN